METGWESWLLLKQLNAHGELIQLLIRGNKHTQTHTSDTSMKKWHSDNRVLSKQLDLKKKKMFWIHIEAHDALKATQLTAASYIYETQIGFRNSPHMHRLNKQHVGLRIAFICDL